MKKAKTFISLTLTAISVLSLAACNKSEEAMSESSYRRIESSYANESSETIQSSKDLSSEESIDAYSSIEPSANIESSVFESEPDSESEDEKNAIRSIVESAYSSADRGEWNEAVQTLEEAQLTYPDNNDINSAYEDIKRQMPMNLSNIVTVSSEHIEVLSDPIKDRYGNVYDGGVQYDTWNYDAFGLYNLDKKYIKFNATAFVSTESANGRKMSISIYLDNKLAFYKDEITEESKPLEISLDVSNADTMRILTSDENKNASSRLIFGNTDFTKVEG